MKPKTKVYIDGSNMFYAQMKLEWFFDWKKIKEYLQKSWDILEIRYYTGIKSEAGAVSDAVVGIMHYVSAPGIEFQKLDRDKHDGLKIDGARFYHDFIIPSAPTAAGGVGCTNVWTCGINITT